VKFSAFALLRPGYEGHYKSGKIPLHPVYCLIGIFAMKAAIETMMIEHYDAVRRLWGESEGIGLSSADNKTSTERFLNRNSGLSFIAAMDDAIAGAILCGENSRRGSIHHLAVAQKFRQNGIGTALVNRSIIALRKRGIKKCHLFVFMTNTALSFWQKTGWRERFELILLSRDLI